MKRTRPLTRAVRWLAMVSCLAVLASCETVPPCGEFTFTGSEVDGSTVNGVDMDVSFDFDPGACGSTLRTSPTYIRRVKRRTARRITVGT